MDNRDIDFVVPETTADRSDLEEEDLPEVPRLTAEYVTYNGASYHAFMEVNNESDD